MNFSSEQIREDIQNQINDLGMEAALFLNNIKKIEIDSPGRKQVIQRMPSDSRNFEEIRILDNNNEVSQSKKWRIFEKTGTIPSEVQSELNGHYEYDIRIAVSEDFDDQINRLFSYFKTEIRFPFPAIIHGTFELDDSRNHLVKSSVNEFLLNELANLMISTAKTLTEMDKVVSWNAVKLLSRQGDFDDKIEEMGFYQRLLKKMRSEKLVPVISNIYMSPEEVPVFYKEPFAKLLKPLSNFFPELAVYTEDEKVLSVVQNLGLSAYDSVQFVEKINKVASSLNIGQRAQLILLIAGNYEQYFNGIEAAKMPGLFIDEQGQIIGSEIQALLPPEKAGFKLPDGLNITFISASLFSELRKRIAVKRASELIARLDCFNVEEYRFDTVIRRIVADTNKFIIEKPDNIQECIGKLLACLFQIRKEDREAAIHFPSNVNVRLFTRLNKLRNARELYFGKEYQNGQLMEQLYARIDDTVFVADRYSLGLGDQGENEVTEFLRWLGVAEYPRIVLKDLADEFDFDYEQHVLKNLPYPYTTDHAEFYKSYAQLKADKQYRSIIAVAYVNDFEKILETADFEDILTWFNSDQHIKQIIQNGHEPFDSYFEIWFKSKRETRKVSYLNISAFILWKLSTTAWVRTKNGGKLEPKQCCLDNMTDLSPVLEIPFYDLQHNTLVSYNVRQEDIDYILEKIGIARTFEKLSDETIYTVLDKLEITDPEGKKARSIYRQIVQSKSLEWSREIVRSEIRSQFAKNGTILSLQNNKATYLPVKSVYYVENLTFCKEIINRFPVVQIDRRSGKDRVKDIFGVMPLEDIEFSLTQIPEVHILNNIFSRALDSFKPYILVFRLGKQSFKTELNNLKKLRIVLCTHIQAAYEFMGTKENLHLNRYEHIYIAKENTAYMLLDSEKHLKLDDLKNDIDFCEALAEILIGILKVGENRKDYRELFPKDKLQRDLIISNDFDDPSLAKLGEARTFLGDIEDLAAEFWQVVLRAKGLQDGLELSLDGKDIVKAVSDTLNIDPLTIAELYDNIHYDNYSDGFNLPLFRKLFTAIDITVAEFNMHSSIQIDFQDFLKTQFERERSGLILKFKTIAFSELMNKDSVAKERFVKCLNAFQNSSIESTYNINDTLVLDIKECFQHLFRKEQLCFLNIDYDILNSGQNMNIDAKYTENRTAFKQRLIETGGAYDSDIETFFDNSENRSLIYFGELDELVSRFDQKFKRPTKTENSGSGVVPKRKKGITLNGIHMEYDQDDFTQLSLSIETDLQSRSYDINSYTPSKPIHGSGLHSGFGGGGSRRGGITEGQTKEIGFIGEKYVYEILVHKYSKERVTWASQYAAQIGINPEGRDDVGYDIWYLDESGNKKYIEVKSSAGDDHSFSISKAEVRFGEQHKLDYEIIIVQNVYNNTRSLLNLGNIFHYSDADTFSNNHKFAVETEGFRIRFR
jgi:hypothetical protein